MTLCNCYCVPVCDFCLYAIHEYWIDDEGNDVVGGPIGCRKHDDKEHQEIASDCGYCDDFYCFRVVKKNENK